MNYSNKKMNFVNTMGYCVYNDILEKIKNNDQGVFIINTISPNSYGIATKDIEFKKALKSSNILVLDGVYFALASILKYGKGIRKNQGPDVFYHFMKRMNQENGKVFFLGSSNKTLERIKKRNSKEYPSVKVEYLSPPYKNEFSDKENKEIIATINNFSPDVLFVGMTCPKQEKWVYMNKNKIKAKYAISIGGVFDWYAGNEKEIAPIWWRLNLAWLVRTINRPEILKRYPNIGIFFMHLFYSLIGIKKY